MKRHLARILPLVVLPADLAGGPDPSYVVHAGDPAYEIPTYHAHRSCRVIEATAEFCVNRGTHDKERDRYETERLVSVQEGRIGIANGTYTNAIAKKNLQMAIEANRLLRVEPDPDWARAAEKLYIPLNEAREVHSTYEGAAGDTLGDVPAAAAQTRQAPPVLEFPEPGLDDTAAYQGYTTRFYWDWAKNAYQVYLKRREGRVVAVWANGANESLGFTVRDTAGRPVFLEWGSPMAEVAASGKERSVAYVLRSPVADFDVGLFLLGSMRKERDFQYHELHLQPFGFPLFIPEELVRLIANLERLARPERASHVAALGAAEVEELRDRLRPELLRFEQDTLLGVRWEHVTFDGENLLVLELAVDRRRATVDGADDRVRVRSRSEGPVSVWIRTTTNAPALHALTREEIFNDAFLGAYEQARAEADSLKQLPEAHEPGTREYERILRFRRLQRQVRGLELLSYEEKLMAGLPNFATYFGRDMLMTALMMEPIWRPEMLEHVVGSVLRKLSPAGEASHEEALGGQAIRENAAEYNRLVELYWTLSEEGAKSRADTVLARAREILEDLQRVRENYMMRDDDFQFPVVAGRWLTRPDVSPETKRSFLLASPGEGRPSHLALLLGNLAYVAGASAGYVADPKAVNLVGFRRLGEERWFPGSWRDSRAGYANGRFAMDVNVVWVPNALQSIARIAAVLEELGFGIDDLIAAEPAIRDSPLLRYMHDREALDEAARSWDRALRHFQVSFGPAEIARQVNAKLEWMPEPESSYWQRVLAQTGAASDSLSFLALALDAAGNPIPVANTDPAMALVLEDYTERILREEMGAAEVNRLIEVFLRPYPVGLFVPGLGPLAANDAYASGSIWEAYWNDTYHSPRVVWGREVNLFLFGVARQIEQAYTAEGRLRDARLEPYVRFLAHALDRMGEAVETSGLAQHELWSYRIEGDTLRPVRYGTSTDIQLWNLTDLSVQHVLARMRER